MPQPKWCETCSWWSFTYRDDDKKFGTCENIFVQDSIRLVRDDDSIDEITIFTEACFGCVWHEGRDLVVAEIKPDILK